MTAQTLRISELAEPGGNGAPRLPRLELAGLWLSDAGFPVGVEVRVEVVEAGRLVVTRVAEGGGSRSMRERLFTVSHRLQADARGYAFSGRPGPVVPYLRLSGRWLGGLGFAIGSRVRVSAESL